MHLLTAQAGQIDDGNEPIDFDQPPGDIVFLTSQDTDITGLFTADQASRKNDKNPPSLRAANLLALTHNYSIDLYLEKTCQKAKLIIVRVLGGPSYWPYGLQELQKLARAKKIKLAVIPGASYKDETLSPYNEIAPETAGQIWDYLKEGGAINYQNCLSFAYSLVDPKKYPAPPKAAPLPLAGIYWPGKGAISLKEWQKLSHYDHTKPTFAISFYRALLQAGDLEPVDSLIKQIQNQKGSALPLFANSFKNEDAASIIRQIREKVSFQGVINLTAFCLNKGTGAQPTLFDEGGAPVFQAMLSGYSKNQWEETPRGASAKDIAMNIALPEVDGRIITRAISFKQAVPTNSPVTLNLTNHQPEPSRVKFTAELARNWACLSEQENKNKKLALILPDYPMSKIDGDDEPQASGHIGHAVGLDTPASTINLLNQLKANGYKLSHDFKDGTSLMKALQAYQAKEPHWPKLSLSAYHDYFQTLPQTRRDEVIARWGPPEDDPYFDKASESFLIQSLDLGHIQLAVQPARGHLSIEANLDLKQAHHDLTIPPTHIYLAFYHYLRQKFGADAIIHMGKHGNLEWMAGKAVALSDQCWPELIFGPTPHLYSFICNDPGEGAQAKRRTAAVILDHLPPPLTRAETYGTLRQLEQLVDEYFLSANFDQRRLEILKGKILDLTAKEGLDKDCDFTPEDTIDDKLQKLDNFLCTVKELQIKGGLHIYGDAPMGRIRIDLLHSLTRLKRASAKIKDGHRSLTSALATDLKLDINPHTASYSEPWHGAKPLFLDKLTSDTWRTNGDTIERLELLALKLIEGKQKPDPNWPQTNAILNEIKSHIAPLLDQSARDEIKHLLAGLDGKFIPPGPSGAPTRGRIDILPTGRNFYSVDTRIVPTPTAFELGKKSAELLVLDYMQTNGAWPKQMAISAWATANMRTGGDDIAQALCLLGVTLNWEGSSGRITGFEIIPLSKLGRPRVDILFRMSGFFRDAFPQQITLLQNVIEAVARLEEPLEANPIRASVLARQNELIKQGVSEQQAFEKACLRLFSSKEGSFGAGLKPLIHSGSWQDRGELAETYMRTSAYGVSKDSQTSHEPEALAQLLGKTDAIVQNQDAREFDLLDSEDYYQFEGGLSAAVEAIKGKAAPIYHNDHSNPQNPKIQSLQDELSLIIRARATNPKWLEGMKKHGGRGVSEIAQTVTSLYGFAALTNLVEPHHFEQLFKTYVEDEEIRSFMMTQNRPAFDEIIHRFDDAIARKLWVPKRNQIYELVGKLKGKNTSS